MFTPGSVSPVSASVTLPLTVFCANASGKHSTSSKFNSRNFLK